MKTSPNFPNPFKFFWQNRDTLLLAILLSVAVWVSAVYANDPNQESFVDPVVPLHIIAQDDSLVLINDLPENIEVKLRAPESVWQAITENPDLISATLDLTQAVSGDQTLPVSVSLFTSPAQILQVTPAQILVQLDDFVVRDDLPISLVENGEIAEGFQKDTITLDLDQVTVSGPASRMELVSQVIGTISLQDARQTFTSTVSLFPANADGELISGLGITPKYIDVDVEISQAGQYRDVAVVVETRGEPASGYESTSIDVDPLIVTLYAKDEEDIAEIPGFVSTKPILLTGKTASFVTQIGLDLPDGVIQAGEVQTVAVSIGISPKVKNTSLSVPISIQDLSAGLTAELSPDNVEVFLSGPEQVMNTLLTSDVVVFVTLEDHEPGTYFINLTWDVLLEQIEVISINPDTIEVIISETVEGNAGTPTPTPEASPTPTP